MKPQRKLERNVLRGRGNIDLNKASGNEVRSVCEFDSSTELSTLGGCLMAGSFEHEVQFSFSHKVIKILLHLINFPSPILDLFIKLHGLRPRANYTDRATAACRRSECQLVRIEGATWSA
jgi:hypothetical protein